MPDVHGRPAAKDVTAAANCDHAHVRVVTASDVHFSRELLEMCWSRRSSPSVRTSSIVRLLQTVTAADAGIYINTQSHTGTHTHTHTHTHMDHSTP